MYAIRQVDGHEHQHEIIMLNQQDKFPSRQASASVRVSVPDEIDAPFTSEELAKTVQAILLGIPSQDNRNADIRYIVDEAGPSFTLKCAVGGSVYTEMATVVFLHGSVPVPENFGSTLCAAFDRHGDKAVISAPRAAGARAGKPLASHPN